MKTLKQAQQKTDTEKAVDLILQTAGIIYTANPVARDHTRGDWTCDSWHIAITRPGLRGTPTKTETFDYYTGTGHRIQNPDKRSYLKEIPHPPHAAGPIHSLILDADAAEENFSDWCDSLGYDDDSLTAFDTYRACIANGRKLKNIFTPGELAKLRDALEDY